MASENQDGITTAIVEAVLPNLRFIRQRAILFNQVVLPESTPVPAQLSYHVNVRRHSRSIVPPAR